MSRYGYSRSGMDMSNTLSFPTAPQPLATTLPAFINTTSIQTQQPAQLSTPSVGSGKGKPTTKNNKHANDPAWRLRQLIPKCKQIRVGGSHPSMKSNAVQDLLKQLGLLVSKKKD